MLPKPARRGPKPSQRIPRRKRGKVAASERELDTLWSRKVRLRAPICQLCLVHPTTDAHHIYGRTRRSVRWDPDNGVGLCRQCHRLAHRFPEDFIAAVPLSLLAPARFEALRERARQIGTPDRAAARAKLEAGA